MRRLHFSNVSSKPRAGFPFHELHLLAQGQVHMMSTTAKIILLLAALSSALPNPLSVINSTSSTYDYVVVGCGIGGLVVASRLSENSEISVLCIEAGPL